MARFKVTVEVVEWITYEVEAEDQFDAEEKYSHSGYEINREVKDAHVLYKSAES